jgi:hypothetical protein
VPQADFRQLLDAGGQRGGAEERLPRVLRFPGFRLGPAQAFFRLRFLLLVERRQDGAHVALVAKFQGAVGLRESASTCFRKKWNRPVLPDFLAQHTKTVKIYTK